MSTMAMLATPIYALVVLACLGAALAARHQHDRKGDVWHWRFAALVFVGLWVMRLADGEDALRAALRESVRSAGQYGGREDWQVPLAISFALVALAIAVLFVRAWQKERRGSRARWVLLAQAGLSSLMPLFGLRLVSLHQTDRLLYSGPVRLNWLIEGAICATVALAAYAYWRRCRG